MNQYPLVSVNIPTRNSSKTLSRCIEAVKSQTYPNIEIIVIDSKSIDDTIEIAQHYSSQIISTNWKLLGARHLGVQASKGEFLLLLDSDQILYPTTVERLVSEIDKYDMICLEETAYNPQSFLEKLFVADRNLVNRLADLHLDPTAGVMLPRFYNKSVLQSAFERIPIDKLHDVVAHDHAIIYYEAYQFSNRVGVIQNAVMHQEPSTLLELWRKNYRYGVTTRELLDANLYTDLIRRKTRFRRGSSFLDSESLQSFFLLLLKGIPYILGLKFGGKAYKKRSLISNSKVDIPTKNRN